MNQKGKEKVEIKVNKYKRNPSYSFTPQLSKKSVFLAKKAGNRARSKPSFHYEASREDAVSSSEQNHSSSFSHLPQRKKV